MTLPSALVVPGVWLKSEHHTCSVKPTTRSLLWLRRQWLSQPAALAEVIRSRSNLSRNERRTGERCF
jgi:hypothetical protein